MKKIFFSLLLVAGLTLANGAQAQQVHTRISYYYYPDQNVYYNPHTRQYAYDDNGNWGYRRDLPSNVVVRRGQYVTVYGDGPEIWRENATHREKYKNWKWKHKKRHH